jgi:hypothetical protein
MKSGELLVSSVSGNNRSSKTDNNMLLTRLPDDRLAEWISQTLMVLAADRVQRPQLSVEETISLWRAKAKFRLLIELAPTIARDASALNRDRLIDSLVEAKAMEGQALLLEEDLTSVMDLLKSNSKNPIPEFLAAHPILFAATQPEYSAMPDIFRKCVTTFSQTRWITNTQSRGVL